MTTLTFAPWRAEFSQWQRQSREQSRTLPIPTLNSGESWCGPEQVARVPVTSSMAEVLRFFEREQLAIRTENAGVYLPGHWFYLKQRVRTFQVECLRGKAYLSSNQLKECGNSKKERTKLLKKKFSI